MNDAATMRSTTPYEAGMAGANLGFAQPVPDSGYRWWYVDGFSECGRFGVTVIAFIGSVFPRTIFALDSAAIPRLPTTSVSM
jgi:hypothetical protein